MPTLSWRRSSADAVFRRRRLPHVGALLPRFQPLPRLPTRPPAQAQQQGLARTTSYTSFTNCPYSLKIAPDRTDARRFVIQTINSHHNHAPFPQGLELDNNRTLRAANLKRKRSEPPESASSRQQCMAPPRLANAPSVARSNVSMATHASGQTDASAALHLVSLGLGEPLGEPLAPAEPRLAAGCRGHSPPAPVVDAEVALRAVLDSPPAAATLAAVFGLAASRVDEALEYSLALEAALELHAKIVRRPCGVDCAHPCIQAGEDAGEALGVVLANPPHRSPLRIVGDLDESHTNRALNWAKTLHDMLKDKTRHAKSTWSIKHHSHEQWFDAVKDPGKAKELKEWNSAMAQLLDRRIQLIARQEEAVPAVPG